MRKAVPFVCLKVFTERVDVGDTLVLYVKEGAFGVRWAYKYGVKGRI